MYVSAAVKHGIECVISSLHAKYLDNERSVSGASSIFKAVVQKNYIHTLAEEIIIICHRNKLVPALSRSGGCQCLWLRPPPLFYVWELHDQFYDGGGIVFFVTIFYCDKE